MVYLTVIIPLFFFIKSIFIPVQSIPIVVVGTTSKSNCKNSVILSVKGQKKTWLIRTERHKFDPKAQSSITRKVWKFWNFKLLFK